MRTRWTREEKLRERAEDFLRLALGGSEDLRITMQVEAESLLLQADCCARGSECNRCGEPLSPGDGKPRLCTDCAAYLE